MPPLGATAAEYLMQKGHTKVAFLSGLASLPAHQQLVKGLRRGLGSRGLELKEDRIGCSGYEMGKAFAILDGWFRTKRGRPTAVVTSDDQMLLYMYDYVERRGFSMPKDVAVLNRGNSTPEHHLRPKPTTLVTPTFRMGELAADLLIDSIENPGTPPQRVLLPYELAPGSTT